MIAASALRGAAEKRDGLFRGRHARERTLVRGHHGVPQHHRLESLVLLPSLGNAGARLGLAQKISQERSKREIVRRAHGVFRSLHLRHERAGHAKLGHAMPGVAGDVRTVPFSKQRVGRALHHRLRDGISPPEKLIHAPVDAQRGNVAAPPRTEKSPRDVVADALRLGRHCLHAPARGGLRGGLPLGRRQRRRLVLHRLCLRHRLRPRLGDGSVGEIVGLERVGDVDAPQELRLPLRLAAESHADTSVSSPPRRQRTPPRAAPAHPPRRARRVQHLVVHHPEHDGALAVPREEYPALRHRLRKVDEHLGERGVLHLERVIVHQRQSIGTRVLLRARLVHQLARRGRVAVQQVDGPILRGRFRVDGSRLAAPQSRGPTAKIIRAQREVPRRGEHAEISQGIPSDTTAPADEHHRGFSVSVYVHRAVERRQTSDRRRAESFPHARGRLRLLSSTPSRRVVVLGGVDGPSPGVRHRRAKLVRATDPKTFGVARLLVARGGGEGGGDGRG